MKPNYRRRVLRLPDLDYCKKNRHGRFQESKLFEELFEQIVLQCVEVGLVQGKHLSVDGSFVEANAAKESRIPREQLVDAAQVKHSVRQYLVELERRIRRKNRCIRKIKYRPPTRTRLMPPKAARQRDWATTTTIWWTITVA
jgi:hypothetical protein